MNSKPPPFCAESEMAVIASMIEDRECIEKVSFLSSSDFYVRMNRLIFEMILDKNNSGSVVDAVTIMDNVTAEMGGIAYVADVIKQKSSVRNVVAYANKVLDHSIRRSAIKKMGECCDVLHDPKSDFIGSISSACTEIDNQIARKTEGDVLTIDQLIELSIDEMEFSNSNIRSGIRTGIAEIDERLGDSYMAFGEITVLGGLSKNGKTLFANTITARMDLLDDEVGHLFSIEMPSSMMFNAIISARTGVPANFYRKQDFYHKNYPERFDEWFAKWGMEATHLRDSRKFSIDGKKEVDADYVCSQMRKQAALAKNAGKRLRFVLIDHLHRMNFHNGSGPMTYAIRDSVRKIKNTASDIGVAVLLLAQLNNRAEDQNPTSYHILDSASVRHEMQAFIGTRIFRENGQTYFGVYADSQRYADSETVTGPAYMILVGGVLRSMPPEMKSWRPTNDLNN